MQAIAVPGTTCRIVIVDNAVLRARWAEIEAAIYAAFADAAFNDPHDTVESPLRHTLAGLNGHLGRRLRHLLALDDADRIIGAVFCLPTHPDPGRIFNDVGWIFTAPHLRPCERHRIADAMILGTFDLLKSSGIERIITKMGTAAGLRILANRYGFVHQYPDQKKGWVKDLSL